MNGFISALKSKQGFGEVINIGNGFEISVGDTVKLIANIIGKEIEIVSDSNRIRPEKSEVERLWASNQKAKDLLNWQPAYNGLQGFRKGLEETIEWFKKPENLKDYKAEVYNV